MLESSAFGIFQSGHHDSGKYELIYVRRENLEDVRSLEDYLRKSEEIFEEFNRDCLRPSDYYGYSVSVGDVIGYYNHGEFSSYIVMPIGFERIEGFMSPMMKQKFLLGEDVRVEKAVLEARAQEEVLSEDLFARFVELSAFDPIFELADKRAVLLGEREPEGAGEREGDSREY